MAANNMILSAIDQVKVSCVLLRSQNATTNCFHPKQNMLPKFIPNSVRTSSFNMVDFDQFKKRTYGVDSI